MIETREEYNGVEGSDAIHFEPSYYLHERLQGRFPMASKREPKKFKREHDREWNSTPRVKCICCRSWIHKTWEFNIQFHRKHTNYNTAAKMGNLHPEHAY
jgi:hypothetical protein